MRSIARHGIIFLTTWLLLMLFVTWPAATPIVTMFVVLSTVAGATFLTFVVYAVYLKE